MTPPECGLNEDGEKSGDRGTQDRRDTIGPRAPGLAGCRPATWMEGGGVTGAGTLPGRREVLTDEALGPAQQPPACSAEATVDGAGNSMT